MIGVFELTREGAVDRARFAALTCKMVFFMHMSWRFVVRTFQ